ncbi:cadherin-like domain-containing protein [Bradyrhizobium sp. SSUT77]|uniref:cadherin-like domain-containing protein n=1 Tax=Bradyrhizobium sp. SSUT77 TaxID=3040603 RepID=UPI00244CA4F9|nr:cadherin-like domain-containing protein [Bradyrhizobium sp. SSUT77]MDH2348629.1 cadherin-like domain-containing protein [Bradyrhizobium sp. SSUT77]
MDEPLSLGIPDRSAIDAPARRFVLIEERSRVSSIVPAMLIASWALLVKQMFGAGKEEVPHLPKAESPDPSTAQAETEADAAPSTAERPPGSSELVRAFIGSVSMKEAFEPAVDLDRLHFIRTDGPRLSLVPANQNIPPSPHQQAPAAEAKPAGGGGGGGGGDPHGRDGERPGDDPKKPPPTGKDPPPDPKRVNHAPVSAGAVDLGSGLVNESIIISLSQLLTGTRDPDGDALSVQGLRVDHGSLQVLSPDRWLYTPEHDDTGAVQFSYRISDGTVSIVQTAHSDLHAAPDEELHGTDGDDFLIGTPKVDVIDAGAGNDIVYGRESNDTIYGGAGDDRLVGGDGDDTLFGGPGNDVIFGGAGNDALFGEAGNDILYGEDGNDLILGGEGDDFTSGGQGNDTILGGAGNDTLRGDEGSDAIDGEEGNDHIDGGAGNDRLIGGAGNDCINGGSGNDTVAGGDGDDHIAGGSGDDTLRGDAGNDRIHGGSGDDVVDGGGGSDTLWGDNGKDNIEGGDGDDCLAGGAGDDTLSGGTGDDHLDGGAGNDVLAGGTGDDRIEGGCGDDVVVLSVDGGHDVIDGGAGNDTLDLSQIVFDENVDLPDGIVEICDGQTAQIFEIENVHGGHGRDRLVADAHVNIMEGGDGDDTFVFQGLASLANDGGPRDHIVDFRVGDKIDLSRIGQELDDFSGQKLFYAGADEAKFDEVGAVGYRHELVSNQEITVVSGNLDGNPDHEFEIVLDGNVDLSEANFVLTTNQPVTHHV